MKPPVIFAILLKTTALLPCSPPICLRQDANSYSYCSRTLHTFLIFFEKAVSLMSIAPGLISADNISAGELNMISQNI